MIRQVWGLLLQTFIHDSTEPVFTNKQCSLWRKTPLNSGNIRVWLWGTSPIKKKNSQGLFYATWRVSQISPASLCSWYFYEKISPDFLSTMWRRNGADIHRNWRMLFLMPRKGRIAGILFTYVLHAINCISGLPPVRMEKRWAVIKNEVMKTMAWSLMQDSQGKQYEGCESVFPS